MPLVSTLLPSRGPRTALRGGGGDAPTALGELVWAPPRRWPAGVRPLSSRPGTPEEGSHESDMQSQEDMLRGAGAASPALAQHVGALPLLFTSRPLSLWRKEGCESVRPSRGADGRARAGAWSWLWRPGKDPFLDREAGRTLRAPSLRMWLKGRTELAMGGLASFPSSPWALPAPAVNTPRPWPEGRYQQPRASLGALPGGVCLPGLARPHSVTPGDLGLAQATVFLPGPRVTWEAP